MTPYHRRPQHLATESFPNAEAPAAGWIVSAGTLEQWLRVSVSTIRNALVMRVEGRGHVIAEGVQDPGFHANTTKGIKEIREKEKERNKQTSKPS